MTALRGLAGLSTFSLRQKTIVTSRYHGSTVSGNAKRQLRRRRSAKNDMFILTNNNFPRASRYFEHFFAVVAPLRHETS